MFNKDKQKIIINDIDNLIGDRTLKKGAFFTDIHFGKKTNSSVHNQDCLDFITFFCEQVSNDPSIDHIVFLGDWHENRSSLNLSTMLYSYNGIKALDSLNLPIFFIVGNHDLYHRNNREIHSLPFFNELNNVIPVDEPVLIEQIFGTAFISPFIFEEEYAWLANSQEYNSAKTWLGHFEFKGFYITGTHAVMKSGPSIDKFNQPTRIFSGHFHKRQSYKNVTYIGNTFPMDFSDAGDDHRGMAIYDYENDKLDYINWTQCPKYQKIYLTDLLDENTKIWNNATLKCICDISINYEESIAIKDTYSTKYNLREFIFDEEESMNKTISETDTDIEWDEDTTDSIDDFVVQMIKQIQNEKVDTTLLIEQYNNLPKEF